MPNAATIDEVTVPIIGEICGFIQANLDGPLTLARLGGVAGMSAAHLQRLFKQVVGVSPRQYADACRLDRLKVRLKEGDNVTRAMMGAGYGSTSRLYERAAAQLGMTPKQYQNGAPAARIRYATASCALGMVLLAATDRGVCAVSLGGAQDQFDEFLASEFPQAELHHDRAGLAVWLQALVRHLNGQEPHLDLPLDVRATAFQRKVWEELQRIPYGETRSYRQVAAALGNPKAVRAVARACATNPAAVAIPCHRVVGSDGNLTGYRWGVKRKQKMLEQEKRATGAKTQSASPGTTVSANSLRRD